MLYFYLSINVFCEARSHLKACGQSFQRLPNRIQILAIWKREFAIMIVIMMIYLQFNVVSKDRGGKKKSSTSWCNYTGPYTSSPSSLNRQLIHDSQLDDEASCTGAGIEIVTRRGAFGWANYVPGRRFPKLKRVRVNEYTIFLRLIVEGWEKKRPLLHSFEACAVKRKFWGGMKLTFGSNKKKNDYWRFDCLLIFKRLYF